MGHQIERARGQEDEEAPRNGDGFQDLTVFPLVGHGLKGTDSTDAQQRPAEPGKHRSADQPPDMSPVINARREADEQIDRRHPDDSAQGRTSDGFPKEFPILIDKDAMRAQQPKDRCRGSQGGSLGEHHREHIARKTADRIQRQKAPPPEVGLQSRAEQV